MTTPQLDLARSEQTGPTARPRWCLGTRLVVAGTALWSAFLAAHLALDGNWWVWLWPASVPPVLFAAVPVVLLAAAWWARPVRWRLGAVLVLCLALGWPLSGVRPFAPWTAGGSAAPADAVRVFSWNTEYWHQDDDPDAFYRFLRAQRADVYLLQEYLAWDRGDVYGGFSPVDDLDRLRREFPGFHVATRGELLTLSRYPIVAAPAVRPDPAALGDPGAGFADVFGAAKTLRTDLRVGGRVLSVYNVHLAVQLKLDDPTDARFWVFPRAADRQRRAQLAGLTGDVAGNANPVLVAGDFNTSPAMAGLEELDGRLTDALAASPEAFPATWPAGAPLWRLDWAFTGNGTRVHGYGFGSPEGLSDHLYQHLVLSVG
ncbi:endonuclease/exonuclease/phosphatase family protein [Longispora sp. NPDC051575]|uniref:endonuclease/exonuclease/phosphatase family protein n=1 Tax=Longispora sp. NPDC051575 TaxID=3154943 RepID=UPI0034493FF3